MSLLWASNFPTLSKRVDAFIDGFNLYHAIDDLRENHLKWINLRELCEKFAARPGYTIKHVYYFSAYATWLRGAFGRHRAFVGAIEECGATPVLGNFKQKDRKCRRCGTVWIAHEEKETDVNIALYLLDGANRDEYDRALLFSADSDLTPAVKMVKTRFPEKEVHIVTPIGRHPSGSLMTAANQRKPSRIKKMHLESCLLPERVKTDQGVLIAERPLEYDPPSS